MGALFVPRSSSPGSTATGSLGASPSGRGSRDRGGRRAANARGRGRRAVRPGRRRTVRWGATADAVNVECRCSRPSVVLEAPTGQQHRSTDALSRKAAPDLERVRPLPLGSSRVSAGFVAKGHLRTSITTLMQRTRGGCVRVEGADPDPAEDLERDDERRSVGRSRPQARRIRRRARGARFALRRAHDGDRTGKLVALVGVEGEDAKRLERIAEARRQ